MGHKMVRFLRERLKRSDVFEVYMSEGSGSSWPCSFLDKHEVNRSPGVLLIRNPVSALLSGVHKDAPKARTHGNVWFMVINP